LPGRISVTPACSPMKREVGVAPTLISSTDTPDARSWPASREEHRGLMTRDISQGLDG